MNLKRDKDTYSYAYPGKDEPCPSQPVSDPNKGLSGQRITKSPQKTSLNTQQLLRDLETLLVIKDKRRQMLGRTSYP